MQVDHLMVGRDLHHLGERTLDLDPDLAAVDLDVSHPNDPVEHRRPDR